MSSRFPTRWFCTLTTYAAALCLPLIAALFVNPHPHHLDILFYGQAGDMFARQLWHGEGYPRWLMEANGGGGSPVFLFYGPLSYYLTALLYPLHTIDPEGQVRVVVSMLAALIACGFSAHLWLRKIMPEAMARTGALLYALQPYLCTIVYLDYGLAQLWAMAWMPLAMLAAEKILRGERQGTWLFAAAIALIAYTRLPTLLMFCAIPVAYVAYLAPANRKLLYTLRVIAGGALGGALAGAYLLPMALNMRYVSTGHFTTGPLDALGNFGHFRTWLGAWLLLLPLAVLYFSAPKAKRRLAGSKRRRFWWAVMACALFLLTPLSKPLWAALPPLMAIQFPFRWYMAMLLPAAYLAIPWAMRVRDRGLPKKIFWVTLLFIPLLASFRVAFDTTLRDQAERIFQTHYITPPEYHTSWMGIVRDKNEMKNAYYFSPAFLAFLSDQDRAMPEGYRVEEGIAQLRVAQGPRELRIHANVISPTAHVTLRRFYYPGVRLTGIPESAVAPSATYGLIALQLPQGEHDIALSWPAYDGEREGRLVSSLAALIAALGLGSGICRQRLKFPRFLR